MNRNEGRYGIDYVQCVFVLWLLVFHLDPSRSGSAVRTEYVQLVRSIRYRTGKIACLIVRVRGCTSFPHESPNMHKGKQDLETSHIKSVPTTSRVSSSVIVSLPKETMLNLYPSIIHEGDLSPDTVGPEIDELCEQIHAACKGFGTDEV